MKKLIAFSDIQPFATSPDGTVTIDLSRFPAIHARLSKRPSKTLAQLTPLPLSTKPTFTPNDSGNNPIGIDFCIYAAKSIINPTDLSENQEEAMRFILSAAQTFDPPQLKGRLASICGQLIKTNTFRSATKHLRLLTYLAPNNPSIPSRLIEVLHQGKLNGEGLSVALSSYEHFKDPNHKSIFSQKAIFIATHLIRGVNPTLAPVSTSIPRLLSAFRHCLEHPLKETPEVKLAGLKIYDLFLSLLAPDLASQYTKFAFKNARLLSQYTADFLEEYGTSFLSRNKAKFQEVQDMHERWTSTALQILTNPPAINTGKRIPLEDAHDFLHSLAPETFTDKDWLYVPDALKNYLHQHSLTIINEFKEALLKQDPKHPQHEHLVHEMAHLTSAYSMDMAIPLFKQIAAEGDPDYLYSWGERLLHHGRFLEAAAIFQRGLDSLTQLKEAQQAGPIPAVAETVAGADIDPVEEAAEEEKGGPTVTEAQLQLKLFLARTYGQERPDLDEFAHLCSSPHKEISQRALPLVCQLSTKDGPLTPSTLAGMSPTVFPDGLSNFTLDQASLSETTSTDSSSDTDSATDSLEDIVDALGYKADPSLKKQFNYSWNAGGSHRPKSKLLFGNNNYAVSIDRDEHAGENTVKVFHSVTGDYLGTYRVATNNDVTTITYINRKEDQGFPTQRSRPLSLPKGNL